MVGIINWLNGYLRIRVSGLGAERFINLCGYKNIILWNVCRLSDCYEMCISLKAFRQLRPIVRKTKTKVVLLDRLGLPFFVSNLNKRKVFLFGCMFAIFFWQISGNFIWEIDIQGNYQITTEQIEDYLDQQKVHIGMWKKKLDIESLEKQLRITFPEIIWTSGKIDGTILRLNVKEAQGAEIKEAVEEGIQYDLIAHVDGQIEAIIVRKGVPKVKPGDMVTKDMVLVEGVVPVMNDDGTLRENLYVKSDADIYIKYSQSYEEKLPLKYIKKVFTGREKQIPYIRLSERELKLKRDPSYLVSDIIIQENTPKFLDELKIPLKWGTYTHREYQNVETLYTEKEASDILSEKFLQFITTLSEKGVQIIEKDVKIIKDSGNWKLIGEIMISEPVTTLKQIENINITDTLESE